MRYNSGNMLYYAFVRDMSNGAVLLNMTGYLDVVLAALSTTLGRISFEGGNAPEITFRIA